MKNNRRRSTGQSLISNLHFAEVLCTHQLQDYLNLIT